MCVTTGASSQLVVVFTYNVPVGHREGILPAGQNDTDAGIWDSFAQKCKLVVHMTFDEDFSHSIASAKLL